MQYILTVSSSLFDTFFSLLFYFSVLRPVKRDKMTTYVTLFSIGGFLFAALFSLIGMQYLLKSLIMFLWYILLCWYLSNHKIGISFLLPAAFFALIYICELSVPPSSLILFGKQLTGSGSFTMLYGTVESRILLYLMVGTICLITHRKGKIDIQYIRVMQWAFLCSGIFLLAGLIAVLSYATNEASEITDDVMLVLPVIFLAVMVIFIILFVSLARETARKNQLSAKLAKAEMQMEQQKSLYALYQDIQGLRHDLNNHMQALSGLLEQNETEKALQYVQGISQTTGKTGQWINTKDGAVDALLNAKLHRARDAGIQVWASIQYPDPCDTARNDICTIFFNLLDNAIEACENNKDAANRRLRLSTKLVQNFFIIMVENPSEQAPVQTKKGFKSLKGGALHGIGLRQVQEIARKYGGTFRADYDENRMFHAAVMLPQKLSEWVNVSIMRPAGEKPQEGEGTASE